MHAYRGIRRAEDSALEEIRAGIARVVKHDKYIAGDLLTNLFLLDEGLQKELSRRVAMRVEAPSPDRITTGHVQNPAGNSELAKVLVALIPRPRKAP